MVALIVIGGLTMVVCGVWTLVIIFRSSTAGGCLSMVFPPLALIWVLMEWDKAKKPFLITLIGLALFVGGLVPTLMQFKAEAEPVITEYMEAGAARDVDRVYACWYSGEITRERIVELVNEDYWIFSDFKSVRTSSWSVVYGTDATEGHIEGLIVYSSGAERPFRADLVKIGEVWKITDLDVWVEEIELQRRTNG